MRCKLSPHGRHEAAAAVVPGWPLPSYRGDRCGWCGVRLPLERVRAWLRRWRLLFEGLR